MLNIDFSGRASKHQNLETLSKSIHDGGDVTTHYTSSSREVTAEAMAEKIGVGRTRYRLVALD